MKFFILGLLCATAFNISLAQNGYGSAGAYDRTTNLPRDKHFFVLPPNTFWNKVQWKDSIYEFPEFQPGKLELSTGFIPSHHPLLNYNIFLEFVEIKQDNGQVFPLSNPSEVKTIWIGDHQFIYTPSFGYMEIILEGKVSVAEKIEMRAVFELSNGTKYLPPPTDVRTAVSKSTRYYWPEKNYYIFTDRSHVHRAAALQKIIPRQKSKIRGFVKNHKTDFMKKEDILDLVSFCNQEL